MKTKIFVLIIIFFTPFLFSNNKEKMIVNAVYLGSGIGRYQAVFLDSNRNYVFVNMQPEYEKSSSLSEAFSTISYASICKMVIFKQKISYDLSRSGTGSPHQEINYTIDSVRNTGKSLSKINIRGILTAVYLPENGKKIEIQISKINDIWVLNGSNLKKNYARWSFDPVSFSTFSNEEYKTIANRANQSGNKLKAEITISPASESYRNVYASREEDREKVHYRYFWKVENIKILN